MTEATDVPPIISVVIPVFNAGHLLHEQVASLAAQDFALPWEVVIADNGSTDGAVAGLSAVAGALRLRVVDASESSGPAFARNRGAAEARGGWLAFCDADDVTDPSWLSALYAARDRADIIGGRHEVATLNDPGDVMLRGGSAFFDELFRSPRYRLPYAGSANLFMARDVFLGLGGFDRTFLNAQGEDIDLSWRAQRAGLTLSFASDAVVHYRLRSTARSRFHQSRVIKIAEADLFRRHHDLADGPMSQEHPVKRLWWLASRSPFVFTGGFRRRLWFGNLGELVGIWQRRSLTS